MASTGKCEYCGSTVASNEQTCPSCGAPNPNFVADTPRQIFLPKTIEELKEYCAERGMPLLRMRFFIGEDYREPKAFGIYKDGDRFIVYKNKSDGYRAVRYDGPDEEYAVNEIFQKLLSECHNRGIYPDGKESVQKQKKENKSFAVKLVLLQVIIFFFIFIFAATCSIVRHKNDGYYQFNNDTTWYHYGDDWYYTDNDTSVGGWYYDTPPVEGNYSDYYIGDDYNSDWGVSDFEESTTWDSIQESHSSSSSDYDSWDSGGTDWDSDW